MAVASAAHWNLFVAAVVKHWRARVPRKVGLQLDFCSVAVRSCPVDIITRRKPVGGLCILNFPNALHACGKMRNAGSSFAKLGRVLIMRKYNRIFRARPKTRCLPNEFPEVFKDLVRAIHLSNAGELRSVERRMKNTQLAVNAELISDTESSSHGGFRVTV